MVQKATRSFGSKGVPRAGHLSTCASFIISAVLDHKLSCYGRTKVPAPYALSAQTAFSDTRDLSSRYFSSHSTAALRVWNVGMGAGGAREPV